MRRGWEKKTKREVGHRGMKGKRRAVENNGKGEQVGRREGESGGGGQDSVCVWMTGYFIILLHHC